jgi:hypothetical protein
MSESSLQRWSGCILGGCVLVFFVIQARHSFVETRLLGLQLESSRSVERGLVEEAEQLELARAKKAEQFDKAVELEKFYAQVLDDLVETSRTSAEAWAVTQKWKIQPAGGQPIPPPPLPPLPPAPAQMRSPSRTQPTTPSLSTPFIPNSKSLREKPLKLGN